MKAIYKSRKIKVPLILFNISSCFSASKICLLVDLVSSMFGDSNLDFSGFNHEFWWVNFCVRSPESKGTKPWTNAGETAELPSMKYKLITEQEPRHYNVYCMCPCNDPRIRCFWRCPATSKSLRCWREWRDFKRRQSGEFDGDLMVI